MAKQTTKTKRQLHMVKNQQAYSHESVVRKQEPRERTRSRQELREVTLPKRESQKQEMKLGYVCLLILGVVVALYSCMSYLELQAKNVSMIKEITSMEQELADLKTKNTDEYNRIVTSINLEEMREIAIEELGMVYADSSQIILYDGKSEDYVKQYEEIPESESILSGFLGV